MPIADFMEKLDSFLDAILRYLFSYFRTVARTFFSPVRGSLYYSQVHRERIRSTSTLFISSCIISATFTLIPRNDTLGSIINRQQIPIGGVGPFFTYAIGFYAASELINLFLSKLDMRNTRRARRSRQMLRIGISCSLCTMALVTFVDISRPPILPTRSLQISDIWSLSNSSWSHFIINIVITLFALIPPIYISFFLRWPEIKATNDRSKKRHLVVTWAQLGMGCIAIFSAITTFAAHLIDRVTMRPPHISVISCYPAPDKLIAIVAAIENQRENVEIYDRHDFRVTYRNENISPLFPGYDDDELVANMDPDIFILKGGDIRILKLETAAPDNWKAKLSCNVEIERRSDDERSSLAPKN